MQANDCSVHREKETQTPKLKERREERKKGALCKQEFTGA